MDAAGTRPGSVRRTRFSAHTRESVGPEDGRDIFSVRNGQPPASTTLTTSLSAGAQSGASMIYKIRDDATVGVKVPDCKDDPAWTTKQKFAAALRRLVRAGTQSGIANPAPCVNSRTITRVGKNKHNVTFEILFLSDDGGFSRR